MKILVTGDRLWSNVEIVAEVLKRFPNNTTLVHGACVGADTICGLVANELNFTVKEYPANWTKYGRAAGPIRNQQMIDEEHVSNDLFNVCIGFRDNISSSRGTKDMLSRARKAKIPCILVTSTGAFKW